MLIQDTMVFFICFSYTTAFPLQTLGLQFESHNQSVRQKGIYIIHIKDYKMEIHVQNRLRFLSGLKGSQL